MRFPNPFKAGTSLERVIFTLFYAMLAIFVASVVGLLWAVLTSHSPIQTIVACVSAAILSWIVTSIAHR